jgi:hypothetical protein
MKKTISHMCAIVTAIACIQGIHIFAAEKFNPFLNKQNVQNIGEYAISAVNIYVTQETQPTGVFIVLENANFPDEAVKTAVTFIVDSIKNNNSFVATQMLGVLLNDLNTVYGTEFEIEKIITNFNSIIANRNIVQPIPETNITDVASEKTTQSWLIRMWQNIQYYLNRGYQMSRNIIKGNVG